MKFLKRLFLFTLTIILLILFFKGIFFRNFVKYKEIGTRGVFVIEEFNNDNFKSKNIDEIINYSLEKTSRTLQFKLSNPGKFLDTGKANCVGYADYFSSSINQILIKNELDNEWKVSHKIGKIEVFGIDSHQYFSSPFFKDHDFVEIQNFKTRQKIAVDATVYDYLGIDRISLKK